MAKIYAFQARKQPVDEPPSASDCERRILSLIGADQHIALISLRHPAGYVQQQLAKDPDDLKSDMLGTDKHPLFSIETTIDAFGALERWRRRFGERLRIWEWFTEDSALYDPHTYQRLLRRFPQAPLVSRIKEYHQTPGLAFEEYGMDGAWIDSCCDENPWSVVWADRGHIISYHTGYIDDDDTVSVPEVYCDFGWNDLEALRFFVKAYGGREIPARDQDALERALNDHFLEHQERK